MRAARALQFTVGDPALIAGRDVYGHLPDGADGPFVRRVLTELQMVMHDHPVNRARERAGRLAANSLWLWGGGVLTIVSGVYARRQVLRYREQNGTDGLTSSSSDVPTSAEPA